MDRYLTVVLSAEVELEVQRSRFIGRVEPVGDESSAREVIARVRAAHPQARHHCTAFAIGPEPGVRRSNDDGEPSGSAGRPMLDVVVGRGLSDVVAVVTRYFGGTLLGVGGLVRAYGDAVAAALEQAGTRERRRAQVVRVEVSAADAGRVEHALRTGWTVRDVQYGEQVTFLVIADPELAPAIEALTHGAAVLRPAGEVWT